MINNPVYANKGLAAAGAKRDGIINPGFVQVANGIELRDLDSPLYNGAKRERSTVEGACGIVWDIAEKMLKIEGVTRKQIIDECVRAGVNINTAKTQYQHYRAAAGLVKSRVA